MVLLLNAGLNLMNTQTRNQETTVEVKAVTVSGAQEDYSVWRSIGKSRLQKITIPVQTETGKKLDKHIEVVRRHINKNNIAIDYINEVI